MHHDGVGALALIINLNQFDQVSRQTNQKYCAIISLSVSHIVSEGFNCLNNGHTPRYWQPYFPETI